MMPNLYDDETFFAAYAAMPRSRGGLAAAGEWHQLRPLLPPLTGKRVLDLGCGYGWHCRYAAQQGAAKVLGLDASRRMIAQARACNPGECISYRVCGIEEYEYPARQWDCVISNLALHYLADLDSVYANVFRTLTPGGVFLFNIEHPVYTAGVGQDWLYDENGRPVCWPVGCEVTKQHHTLTQILMGLLRQGFVLQAVEEAQPPQEMLNEPGMADEMRRPMMLLVKAAKPGD